MNKSIDFERAWAALSKMDDILILTHLSPDGDAVGSMFALYLALKQLGKNVRCIIKDIPRSLKFAEVPEAFAEFNEKYVVTVDVGDKKLLGSELNALYGERVDLNIDHHGTNVMFAKETLVVPEASAACEVLFDLFDFGGINITKDIANRLYVGIATDTGCFRYLNTTSKTLRTAARLLDSGAESGRINNDLFETKSPQYVAFEKAAVNSLSFYFGGKCAVMLITQKMYDEAGIVEADTQGINGLPRMIEGVIAGVTVKERSGGVFHASVRTRDPINAADICSVFGGGGHKYAAGCELGTDSEAAVIKIVSAVEENLKAAGLL
ncbi:MAG: bifunctional oligoribonuclease/PAP phosphatase NrnA [Oscillospiraceae bacterium]|nr:bifunctional oligoribonuclease/PAP phosphatase NrnA [Oscillospiraceae bacterium]